MKIVIASLLTYLATTSLVWGQDPPSRPDRKPYQTHMEQNIDNHQVGWIDLTINKGGQGTLTATFSNGKQWAGNNFYSITSLRRKNDSIIYAVLQEKGLDGSGMGHAREGSVTNEFTLSKEQFDDLDHVAIQMGVRNCGMKMIEMHNFNDWKFALQPCEKPDMPAPTGRSPNPRTVR